MSRPGLREWALLAAAVVAGGAMIEVGLRQAIAVRASGVPGLGYEYVGGPLHRDLNSMGFRDRDYPAEPPAGTYRIVMVGDSVAYGYGLADPREAAAKVVERALDAAPPRGFSRVEVINAAVEGYDAGQIEANLRAKASRYHPHAVVYAFFINDFHMTEHKGPIIFSARVPPLLPWWEGGSAHRWLADRLVGYATAWGILYALTRDFKKDREVDYPRQRAWGRERLAGIRDLARERGWRLLVAVFPRHQDLAEVPCDLNRPDLDAYVQHLCVARDVKALLDGLGVDAVEIGPVYAAAAAKGVNLNLPDLDGVHPNAEGHRLAGEAIARFIADRWYPGFSAPAPAEN